MTKLIIKEEYQGVTIGKNIFGIGIIYFNPKVDESKYINYKKLGFDIFDEINVIDQKELFNENGTEETNTNTNTDTNTRTDTGTDTGTEIIQESESENNKENETNVKKRGRKSKND